jgi:ferredoxin-NADP reductase/ferredoxin
MLSAADGSPLPAAIAGQYLVLRLIPDRDSPPIIRSYSISGPSGFGTYRISVKRGMGPGSRYLVDTVKIGNTFEASAPRGDFVLRAGRDPVVLLSAGIGVTPVLSMLYALRSGGNNSSREVWWIHAARNAEEHAFAEEARRLIDGIPGSRSLIAYSKPERTDLPDKSSDIQGRIDEAILRKINIPKEADFYLCGPAGFLTDMHRDLNSLGVPSIAIHQEVFGPVTSAKSGAAKTPHLPGGPQSVGPIVSFVRSGLAVPWNNRFRSLLEFAEACDVPVQWSCRTGVCHLCECGILDGKLLYAPEPLDKPAAGNALICCSTPESPVSLDL